MQPRRSFGLANRDRQLFGPFAAAARSPATKSSLSATRWATAAAILQKVLQGLPHIVVGDFLPGLNSAQSHEHDPAPASDRLCIRPTAMIDVTGHVPSRQAIASLSVVELELKSRASCLTPVGFRSGQASSAIGRDMDSALDG